MWTKVLLTVFAASAVARDELQVECTSILQKKSFRSQHEALAEERAELERERGTASGAEIDVMDTKIHAVDSALTHEHEIDELQVMKSKLDSDGYAMFPAGDPLTGIAEQAVNEEIKHQKVHESLALKLEDVRGKDNDAENYVLDAITNELGIANDAAGDSIQKISDALKAKKEDMPNSKHGLNELGEVFYAKIQTAQSLVSHKHLIDSLTAMKSKLHMGGYKQLTSDDPVTGIAEEAVDEEINHQKTHESLVQQLDKVPFSQKHDHESVARNVILDALTKEIDMAQRADADSDEDEVADDSNDADAAADDSDVSHHVAVSNGFSVQSESSGKGIVGLFESLSLA